jgi:Protein of unknown function (DUF2281)
MGRSCPVTFRRLACALAAAWPRTSRVARSYSPSGSCLPTTYSLNTLFRLILRPRIAIEVARPYSVAMKSLEEMIRDLPPDAQRKVEDFVKELAKSTPPTPKRKLDQRWAGALKRYRDQYTSLQLQRKALEWRGD